MRALGYEVENPADHGIVPGAEWADYMAYDLTRPGLCGMIALLTDWENSEGARLEVQLAHRLGIAAVPTITVKATSESENTVGDTSVSRSAMDQIEARSKETLPAALLFNTVPFEGLTEQQINLRISVITSGSVPALKLRWVGEEVQREDIAQEFKAVLHRNIGEAATLSLGAFDPK